MRLIDRTALLAYEHLEGCYALAASDYFSFWLVNTRNIPSASLIYVSRIPFVIFDGMSTRWFSGARVLSFTL